MNLIHRVHFLLYFEFSTGCQKTLKKGKGYQLFLVSKEQIRSYKIRSRFISNVSSPKWIKVVVFFVDGRKKYSPFQILATTTDWGSSLPETLNQPTWFFTVSVPTEFPQSRIIASRLWARAYAIVLLTWPGRSSPTYPGANVGWAGGGQYITTVTVTLILSVIDMV